MHDDQIIPIEYFYVIGLDHPIICSKVEFIHDGFFKLSAIELKHL